MEMENMIGLAAGAITSSAMLPQLVKVIREKEVGSLSKGMLCVLIAGLSLWVYYGVLKQELPIILSNGFAVLLNVTLLSCCFFYKNRKDAG